MKTYLTYENGKKATQAKNKKEASEKMNVKLSSIIISNVHIDYVQCSKKI